MRRAWPIVGLLFVSACALPIPADPQPAPGGPVVTECGPPLAFEGETTLAQLGLGDLDFAAGEANRRGSFQITAWTVRWEEFAPPGVPPRVPEGQLLCVTWADGSGLSTMLEEPFPGPGRAETEQGNGAVGLPIGVVLVGIAAAIVVSVSWLAFRRSPP